jgi:hypothetical protein
MPVREQKSRFECDVSVVLHSDNEVDENHQAEKGSRQPANQNVQGVL